jgi:hypothetical protein
MDVVSIASFLLPTLLSMLSGEGKERLGFPEISSWRKMIRLSADIYKKLTPAQKQKLVDIGVLPPDFENMLLDVFNEYLSEKPDKHSNYYQYRDLLLKIKPEEFIASRNQYNAFKARIRELMSKTFPDVKISTVLMYHPNYSTLYAYWRKIHKIFPAPKK